MVSEKVIEGRILSFLDESLIFAWKNSSVGFYDTKKKHFRKNTSRYHINGVSDILGILPNGKLIAIEVKSSTGRPTPEQMSFISNINRSNGLSFIARSVWQAYTQLLSLWPEIEAFKNIAMKYKQIEENDNGYQRTSKRSRKEAIN